MTLLQIRLESCCVRRCRHFWLNCVEGTPAWLLVSWLLLRLHCAAAAGTLELLLLLLWLVNVHIVGLMCLMLLLRLHCCRLCLLVGTLYRSASPTKFDPDLLWNSGSQSLILVHSCGSLIGTVVLWWETGQVSLDRRLCLIHLEWWHGHVVLGLLAHLQGLLQDVFV